MLLWNPKAEFLVAYEPGRAVHTHRGSITLPEGARYGQAVESSTGETFFLLKPSLSKLTISVKRRTTIVYPKDLGYMLLEAGVGPGSRVAEVGSGSGALTLALAYAVGGEGRVYSFERRPEFLELAKENVARWGLAERVEFYLRDPAKEGFGLEGLDAVFVDVPEPWRMARPAWEALAGGGAWVSISPCVEQIMKTVEALRGLFVATRVVEILEREILARPGRTRPRERGITHTCYIVSARKVISEASSGSGS